MTRTALALWLGFATTPVFATTITAGYVNVQAFVTLYPSLAIPPGFFGPNVAGVENIELGPAEGGAGVNSGLSNFVLKRLSLLEDPGFNGVAVGFVHADDPASANGLLQVPRDFSQPIPADRGAYLPLDVVHFAVEGNVHVHHNDGTETTWNVTGSGGSVPGRESLLRVFPGGFATGWPMDVAIDLTYTSGTTVRNGRYELDSVFAGGGSWRLSDAEVPEPATAPLLLGALAVVVLLSARRGRQRSRVQSFRSDLPKWLEPSSDARVASADQIALREPE